MATPAPIGMKIKRARERKRWTQQELGDAIGVSQKTVDNWENDRTYPRSSIGALEDVLGVRLTGRETRGPVDPHTRGVLRDSLPPEDYRRVIGLMEGTLTWPDDPEPGEETAEGGQSG